MKWLPVQVDDAWMETVWRDGAARLDVEPQATPTPSASGNVIGGPVTHRGETAWLRVAPFIADAMDLEPWRGTRDAAVLTGIRKPELLDSTEWTTGPDPVPIPVCAELMTYASDPVATPGDQYLERPVDLSPGWLAGLRTSLDALAGQPTTREIWGNRPDRYANLFHAFGWSLPADVVPRWGSTEHLDLHWGNITVPNLMILDWEHWGVNVAGYGAARLYCTALAVPTVAAQIFSLFADVLDSPSGRYAILANAAGILSDFTHYRDEAGLCPALHRVARTLLEPRPGG
ncbi:hypothetical protein [Parafrankia discariae]|uniref:hypothetical protein n=1 Tax=Parafrankia discariae TaxID=365528 RepID=UPI00037FAA10|nr:hypothetical protein [Parafrankia discariae]